MRKEHRPLWICMGQLRTVLIYFEFLYMVTCMNTSFWNSIDVKYLGFYQLKIWCASVHEVDLVLKPRKISMMMCLPFILSNSSFMGDWSKYKNLVPIGKHQENMYNLESVPIACYVIVFIRNSYVFFCLGSLYGPTWPKSNSMTVISLFLYSFFPSCFL